MTQAVGIDVSKWQASTPPLAGLDFLFARASIGLTTDERYAMHIANARKAGLIVGAYHFNWDTIPVADQVRLFLAAAGDVDLYALDVEGANAFDLAQTKAFIKGVQAAGKRIGLYMSESAFLDAGQDWNWIAKWSTTPPKRPWDMWQWQGSPLDRDRFRGTRADLLAFAGIPPAPDTAVQEDPMGLAFRITAPVTGTVKVTGDGHALIRVDNAQLVGIPAGQVREVVARIVTLVAVPGHEAAVPAGSTGYLVGNVPGLLPDKSVAAMLLGADGVFTATPVTDCSAAVAAAIAADRKLARVVWP